MRAGIQGDAGSYSAQAAAMLAPTAEIVSFTQFDEVHHALAKALIDAAILPFENTLAGPVTEQYDLLAEHPAEIERECLLHIEHQLIGMPGASIEQIREVFSHPIALRQCRKFFALHPEIDAREFYDTAGSVAYIVRAGRPAWGAIASREAAKQYGGEILCADVQDDCENYTRFRMLRRPGEAVSACDANKLSVLIEVAHRPGALAHALEEFAKSECNLVEIEPSPTASKPFRDRFFVDFSCESADAAAIAIAALQSRGGTVRILGRYRAAERPAAAMRKAG